MGSTIFPWLGLAVLSALFLTTYGGCEFPASWSGRWFQSGSAEGLTTINSTYIGIKGECIESRGDKFIVLDKSSNYKSYKCIVIHQKHPNVLQYKETGFGYPVLKSLDDMCSYISIDSLFSMFRADGAAPIPCPFHNPPYIFSYNGGKGDCNFPPSRADSCTDDWRLLFRYAACPDISGSQSNVEEMVCLATWKDGSSKYLVAKMEHKLATSDEDRYRCFIYDHVIQDGVTVYRVAQSGDATCNGIQSSTDGSKMMRLTRIESQHEKCKFPSWVLAHHHWRSLDYAHNYHFSRKNAALRVSSEQGDIETRLVCHKVVSNSSSQVTLVAHVTTGCDSGYVCMVFHHRDNHVIQVQQSTMRSQDASEACTSGYFDIHNLPSPVTLVTTSLPSLPCPNPGRYGVLRPQSKTQAVVEASTSEIEEHCNEKNAFDLLAVGCNSPSDTMEFHSSCPDEHSLGYNCHGSWSENSTTYIVVSPASRKSTDAKHYCFVFNQKQSQITLHRVAESCILPSHQLSLSLSLTSIGKCTESSASKDSSNLIFPSVFSLIVTSCIVVILR